MIAIFLTHAALELFAVGIAPVAWALLAIAALAQMVFG